MTNVICDKVQSGTSVTWVITVNVCTGTQAGRHHMTQGHTVLG